MMSSKTRLPRVQFILGFILFSALVFTTRAVKGALDPVPSNVVLSLGAQGTPAPKKSAKLKVNWTYPANKGGTKLFYRCEGFTRWRTVYPKRQEIGRGELALASLAAEMDGLTPEAAYEYQIVTDAGLAGPLYKISAPPVKPREFTFAVLGDSRKNFAVARLLADAIAAKKPAFVLHTGDLVTKPTAGQWDQFFTAMENLLPYHPFMPVAGNHEGVSPAFPAYFNLPPNGSDHWGEFWYTFNYGPLHVVCLLTGQEKLTGSLQVKWLIDDLKRARNDPEIKWIIAVCHHPPFSSGAHGPYLPLFTRLPDAGASLIDIFEQMKVDVVISGHDHNYERTRRISGFRAGPQRTMTAGEVDEKKGVYYFVTGGGGAPQRDMKLKSELKASSWVAVRRPDPDLGQSAKTNPCYHFLLATVTPYKLTISAHEVDATIIPDVYDDAHEGIFDAVELVR